MELLIQFIDFFIHLDHHLSAIITNYGAWIYLILFLIIFCETGLVITPFLPGDSLLFVVGALCASGSLHLGLILMLLCVAAILGDSVNYFIGNLMAPKLFRNEKIPLLKQSHLEKTKHFYQRHGSKTIILARFLPIIRTFAPFLAGIGKMHYPKFLTYNVVGGLLWIFLFVLAGYFFGNLPAVKKNFTLVVMAIIVISIIPAIVEFLRSQSSNKK